MILVIIRVDTSSKKRMELSQTIASLSGFFIWREWRKFINKLLHMKDLENIPRVANVELKWMDEFCPQKGVSHVVDDCRNTGHFVGPGVGEWLYDG